jgi:hypothetical protein
MSEEVKAGKIFTAIPKIMADMEPIRKDRKNQQQGFMFRGIEDMYNALQPVMSKHGVFTVPRVTKREEITIQSKSGGNLIRVVQEIVFRFFADDGSFIDVGPLYGEAMDSGDKATNKSNSIAQKYAFLMVFAIPTEDQDDPDKESHQPNFTRTLPPPPPKPSIPKENAPRLNDRAPASGLVTMPQLKRMATIAGIKGWKHEQVSRLIMDRFNLDTSKDLTRQQYDLIVKFIEDNPQPPEPPKTDQEEWDEYLKEEERKAKG